MTWGVDRHDAPKERAHVDASTELALIEREVARRVASHRAPVDLRRLMFDAQLAVWDDTARMRLVLGSRRSGKSVLGAAWLLDRAQRRGGYVFPYVAQSRKNAKLIVWEELRRIVRTHLPEAKLNEADLTVRLANGAIIMLGGCNDRSEVDRWRGPRYGAAFVDECGAMPWLGELAAGGGVT